MPVGDGFEGVEGRDVPIGLVRPLPIPEPFRPGLVLSRAWGNERAPAFRQLKGRQRLHLPADQHAQRERRRAPDAVLAMDEDPLAAVEMAAREGDAIPQHGLADRAIVLRWKAEKG